MPRIVLSFPLRLVVFAASATAIASLTGCAGLTGTALSSAASMSLPSGNVHGGQQPIAGAKVYLYAMSNSGYQTASTNLVATAPGYVTTDASGGFSFAGQGASCPTATSQIYVLAVGGNPGQAPGTNNTASVLLANYGVCSSITNSSFVNINEVSTVAGVVALQQFMTDGATIGTSSTNAAGLANAVATISNMINTSNGTALATTPAGNGVAPQMKLDTLANILAPCANSTGPSSTACTTLFGYATPSGGTAPTNTLAAALNIARFPTSQVANLFSLSTPSSPFQPSLSTAPHDFSVGITYKPSTGTLGVPGLLVIDAAGDVFSANCQSCSTPGATDSIAEFSPTGAFLGNFSNASIHKTQGLAIDNNGSLWTANLASGSSPDEVTKSLGNVRQAVYSGADVSQPMGIAIDASNNAWVTSPGNSNILELSSSGVETGGSPYTTSFTGINSPTGVALDNLGNVFVSSYLGNSILKLSSTGSLLSPQGGYTGAGIAHPIGVSIDSAGDVWTVDDQSNAVSEITNSGGVANSSPFTNLGIYQAAIIAIDGSGSAWIANCRVGCPGSGSTAVDNIVRLSSTGAITSGPDGFSITAFSGVGSTAIDGSGNVWVSNSVAGSITQVVGLASPVKTPLAAAVSVSGRLGTRP